MNRERFQETKRIYTEALERDPAEREAYLAEACAGDEPLRQQVKSLLGCRAEAGDFFKAPAVQAGAKALAKATPADFIGRTLLHYTIVEKIGEGGMGVVYKARDSHLDRFVALKLLPPEKVADPERRRRFVQEAKAASALNHPNIVHIYDIDQSEGTDYIAMEYVDGKTLEQRIAHRGHRLGDALKYAIQIADALAKAHSAGIVHRDLKPTNIMVNADGAVKVLDFGLAKLTERVRGDEDASTATVDDQGRPITEEGVIVGTVAYMSPEQAEGRQVDARSDIFSFGSLLYEMVTGQKAFQGASKMSTLSAILHQEPKPVSGITPTIPADLEKLINRCLRKDPSRRYQHMADVKLAIEEVKEESESGKSATTARRAPRRWLVPVVIGGSLLAAAVAIGLIQFLQRSETPVQAPVLTRLTFDTGLAMNPAISPDGKLLAYASDRGGEGRLDIWVRQITGGNPIRISDDPAGASNPFFFPDSGKIAFQSNREGGGIYVVSGALGGDQRLLAKRGHDPSFSPDGAWIAFGSRGDAFRIEGIGIVSVNGGPVRQIARELEYASGPIWSADGKRVLVYGRRGALASGEEDLDWWVASIDGGPVLKTGARDELKRQGLDLRIEESGPRSWVEDQVFFSGTVGSSANLWRVKLSPKTWRVAGPAERLTFGTGEEKEPSVAAGLPGSLRLVFASITGNVDIWSLPVDANTGRVTGELQRVTEDPAIDARPSVSADATKVAFTKVRPSARANSSQSGYITMGEIFVRDLLTGRETALTSGPGLKHHPVISSDGSRVFYSLEETTRDRTVRSVYAIPAAGGEAEKLCEDCGETEGLSPDGGKLLVGDGGPTERHLFAVFLLNLQSRKRVQLLSHDRWDLYGPRFSPDGRWISFSASVGSEYRAYIAPFREDAIVGEKDWIPMSDKPAREPSWSPDGNLLYYLSGRDGFLCLWAQPLERATKRPSGAPFAVYHSHSVRRSIGAAPGDTRWPAVVRGKILLTQGERTGNIWMMELPKGR